MYKKQEKNCCSCGCLPVLLHKVLKAPLPLHSGHFRSLLLRLQGQRLVGLQPQLRHLHRQFRLEPARRFQFTETPKESGCISKRDLESFSAVVAHMSYIFRCISSDDFFMVSTVKWPRSTLTIRVLLDPTFEIIWA